VRIHGFIFAGCLIAEGEDGPGHPRRMWLSSLCAAFERRGLPEGLTPSPRRPSILCCLKSNSCWAFSMPSKKLFVPPASRPVPSHLRDAIAMAGPSWMARAYRYPHLAYKRSTGRPDLPARRPCKGKFLAARLPGLGRGHRGARLRHGAPPKKTGRRSRKQREQIEIVSSSEADPLLGAAATPGRRLKRERLSFRQRFCRASWQRHEQVLVLGSPFPALGSSPPSAPPLKGAW